jgi:hypothetical protein
MPLPSWLPFHDLASLKSLSVPFRFYLIAAGCLMPVILIWGPWKHGLRRVISFSLRWMGLLPFGLFMVIGSTIWGIRADVLFLSIGNALVLMSLASAIDRLAERFSH